MENLIKNKTMKITNLQVKAIDSVLSIIDTWGDIADISSPIYHDNIRKFLLEDLGEHISEELLESLENILSKLLDTIKEI